MDMKVLIIGFGSIGQSLAKAADKMVEIKGVYVYDKKHDESNRPAVKLSKVTFVKSLSEKLDAVEFVVEAASQEAVQQCAPTVLSAGKDIVILSVGALVDEKLRTQLESLARINHCKIIVPSGAICGLDGILAGGMGSIDKVKLTTIKPPKSIDNPEYAAQQGIDIDNLKEPTTIFLGRAKDAVRLFPKNINIAASVSLAGIGFEMTQVEIIADPTAERIRHHLFVEGDFGRFQVKVENVPSPRNPKTSYLAVLSAISAIKRRSSAVWNWG